MALSEKKVNEIQVRRIYNPIKKKYQKIIIDKKDFKNKKALKKQALKR
jgi:hypothetical protein